jgi:quinol monooxygenase YgiN
MSNTIYRVMRTMMLGSAVTACASANDGSAGPSVREQGSAPERTTATAAHVGLLVRLEAKEGREADVEGLLELGPAMVAREAATTYWFGIKIGPRTYGIFDAFPDDAGRDAHLAGDLAKALMAAAPNVLAKEPTIERVQVLATKDPRRSPSAGPVRVGLLVRLEAKPQAAGAVEKALTEGAVPVGEERRTPVWFAIKMGPTTFGIFDAFTDDASRKEHVASPFAQSLLAAAPQLLSAEPRIEPIDVTGVKIPR